jgi:hypothetical protein
MKELEKEFVPKKESLSLRKLGFDKPCLGRHYTLDGNNWKFADSEAYNNIDDIYDVGDDFTINAPTFSQSFRFFREKYGLRATIMDFIDDEIGVNWDYEIAKIGTDLDKYGRYEALVDFSIDDEYRKFKTYEGSELACLKKLIELVKK